MPSLKQLAIKGTFWTLIGYGTSQALRLGANLILTRLLSPELFGLMALVSTFMIGLALFSDIGLTPSVIQHERGDEPIFLNTAWTLQILRGCLLWFICLLIAWPIANFYGNNLLLWLIPIVGLSTIFDGFSSTALMTLNRQVSLAKLNLFNLSVQIISLIVMIVWAWFSRDIWSLVAGNLVAGILKMVGSYFLIPNYRNRLTWEKSAVEDIISFGKWIFISTACTFIASQADRLLLPKFLSFTILGIYSIALTFALLPQMIISQISSSVLLPILAKLSDTPRQEVMAKILRQRWLILGGGGVLVVALTCFGDWLILGLYNAEFAPASWMLPILAIGIWPNLLFESSRQYLVAIGKPQYQAWGQFVKSIYVCIGLPLGFFFLGLPGFIIMVALNDIGLYCITTVGLLREKLNYFKQDIIATLILFFVIVSVLLTRYYLGFGYPISLLFNPA